MLNTRQKLYITALLSCLTLSISNPVIADDEMTVDQADSFDMEAFHKNDKSSGALNDKPDVAVKTIKVEGKHSVSDLFSLTPKVKGLSVSQIQHQLFTKMALICPQGWNKTNERVTKAGEQFQLEYRFNCIEK